MNDTSQQLTIAQADPDAVEIGNLYRRGMLASVPYLSEAGERLYQKKQALGHKKWLPWLEANKDALGFGDPRTAQRLIKARKYGVNVEYDKDEALRINRLVWGNNARGTTGSGHDQWFTPHEHIARARDVMGGIDCDPASEPEAQKIVQAATFYTEADNGLRQPWHGRVWLNWPYSKSEEFAKKLNAEVRAGHVTEAICLTHNYTDTGWFQDQLATICSAICLTRGRVEFIEGDKFSDCTQGQVFSYIGNNTQRFAQVFRSVGRVFFPEEIEPCPR
jgi:phage N-6-adenine-methyltransferase